VAAIDCDAREYVPDAKADDGGQDRITEYLEARVHGYAPH